MSKQDRQGVRKATDLEQKYNFGKSFAEVMGLARDAQDAANAAKDAADKLDNNLTSDEIFNRLTENGALQGLYKEDGNIYINASYIKSGKISTVHTKVYYASDYTDADLTRLQQIMIGTITPTAEDYDRYDLYGDGTFSAAELVTIRNMLLGEHEWVKVTWYVEIEPVSKRNVMRTYYTVEDDVRGVFKTVETFNVGAGGVSALTLKHSKMDGLLAFSEGVYGGYCRTVDGEDEYINPPMMLGSEYRTTERWLGKPVYTKLLSCALPNETTSVLDLGVTAANVFSIDAYAYNSTGERISLPFINASGNFSVWYENASNNNDLMINTTSNFSDYTAYFRIKYTKD